MNISTIIEAMFASGASPETIMATVKAVEAEHEKNAAIKREKDRNR